MTVTKQEFNSFCCANLYMILIKKVPHLIKIRRLTTIVSTKQVSILWKHYGLPWLHSRNKELLLPWNGRTIHFPFRPLLIPKPQSRNNTRKQEIVLMGWFWYMSLNASSSTGKCRVTLPFRDPYWGDICYWQDVFVSWWVLLVHGNTSCCSAPM